jgi:membrane protein
VAGEPAPEVPVESDEKLREDLLRLLFPWWESLNEGDSTYEDPIRLMVGLADKSATSGKALTISGVLFVLTTVFGLMRNVEWSLNRIWGVKRSRSYFRTTSDYLLVTLLLPFVAAAVLGVTAALASPTIKESLGPFSALLLAGQFGFVTLSFSLLYFFVPNTHVRFQNALLGGTFAALLWISLSWAYVHANVGLARYTLFFSTFAAFPLLLMWTYASWVVLLIGAIVSFAYQNEKTFAMERFADKAPFAYREAVAARILLEAARRFQEGQPGMASENMAQTWNIPLRLVNETLECLIAAKLIVPCTTEPTTYQPARSPDRTQLREVVTALREHGTDPSLLRKEGQYGTLYAALDAADPSYLDASLSRLARQVPAEGNGDESA